MMNNRLVITLLHKKHCWFVLSRFSCSTKLTHTSTQLTLLCMDYMVPDLHHVSCQTLTIWGLPLPQLSPSLASLSRLLVSIRGYPLSTIRTIALEHYSNLFYAYLLVKDLSFPDTQTILSSVFVASLTDLWSSYEFEAAAICPVFYCECLSLIDISSVFVILY